MFLTILTYFGFELSNAAPVGDSLRGGSGAWGWQTDPMVVAREMIAGESI
jgi:hypothetical protein